MNIRLATKSDLHEMTEIYNQAIKERIATCDLDPQTTEDRQSWFGQFDEKHPVFVGETDHNVAGYGFLSRLSLKPGYRFSVENGVYIEKNYRGRGLGKQMLTHLVAIAKKHEFHYLCARIFPHNSASLRLHRSLGFKDVGVEKEIAYIDGQWIDVVILSLLI